MGRSLVLVRPAALPDSGGGKYLAAVNLDHPGVQGVRPSSGSRIGP